ncbi:glyoxalase/bleomycin resistance protein/dioxygenase [Mycolicibacterium thermoresistibile]|nr:extradiol dioxygenase, type I [Mycolicibacterium thermoresistibile]SNW17156.1 glyoxalase/bleomycin resistance protein/dioxygenase [Mycolicibacterium thermoresistibile]
MRHERDTMGFIKSLGYVIVQATDMDRWRHFAYEVLGFAEGTGPNPEALYLRMDERTARITVEPGEVDRIVTIGWEVRDHAALEDVKRALAAAGVPHRQLSTAEADARRVEEVVAFADPAGTALEVFHGPVLDHSPVVTPFGARFVTGDQGLGHVVLPTVDVDGLFEFYTEVLGFRSRGAFRVPAPEEFGPVRVRFLGINERHHSLALCPASTLRDPGLIHLMVEVDTLDAVGQALDRVNRDGYQLSSTLGRHTNDKMVSFYVRAPGDWDIEFGTAGMRVDETYYTAEEITADSYWGHQWVGDLPAAMRP